LLRARDSSHPAGAEAWFAVFDINSASPDPGSISCRMRAGRNRPRAKPLHRR
jgi:hypothetical protein